MHLIKLRDEDLPSSWGALPLEEKVLLRAISGWALYFERPVHDIAQVLRTIVQGLEEIQRKIEAESSPSAVADRLMREMGGSS
ncbi:hypothetical protein [Nitrospira calida]|jgi:hypothetical protein